MIIDTHSHCYWENLANNFDEIFAKMDEKNVALAVQIGCDIETSEKSIDLAQKFPDKFLAVVGYHPESSQNDASWRAELWKFFEKISSPNKGELEGVLKNANFFQEWERGQILNQVQNDDFLFSDIFENPESPSENFENFLEFLNTFDAKIFDKIFEEISFFKKLEKLIAENRDKIVAIGECGLDFHYIDGTNDGKIPADLQNLSDRAKWQIENQKFWWLVQWKLAQKYDFPLVIHSRDTGYATADFMQKFQLTHAVMHSYAENPEIAKKLLDFSSEIYFSFSGIVTYKNAQNVAETAKIIPENRILIETDSPFLSPVPVRGTTNNPSNTRFILEKIAELRGEKIEILEEKIFQNSKNFYKISENHFQL